MYELYKVSSIVFVLLSNHLALNNCIYFFIWLPWPLYLDACLSYSDHTCRSQLYSSDGMIMNCTP